MKRMNNGEQPNISGQTLAEFVEKSPSAKGNLVQATVTSTQRLESASSGLDRVREAAKRDKDLQFTNLLHHIDIERLYDAYLVLNRKASVGVDGVTWREYGEGLSKRLSVLHDQIHSGRYRAKASKRIWIPKSDGRQRPIGIAALEDKIVQQALVEILQVIYEEDFLGFSYAHIKGDRFIFTLPYSKGLCKILHATSSENSCCQYSPSYYAKRS
jgi:RNA-directed DNA polymerase